MVKGLQAHLQRANRDHGESRTLQKEKKFRFKTCIYLEFVFVFCFVCRFFLCFFSFFFVSFFVCLFLSFFLLFSFFVCLFRSFLSFLLSFFLSFFISLFLSLFLSFLTSVFISFFLLPPPPLPPNPLPQNTISLSCRGFKAMSKRLLAIKPLLVKDDHRLVGQVVKVSVSRAADPGSIPAFSVSIFPGRVDKELVLQWLPCQAPYVIGTAMKLAQCQYTATG